MGRFTHLEWKDPKGASKRLEAARAQGEEGASPKGEGPGESRDEAHWLAEAAKEARAGRYEKALRFYSRALEMNPKLAEGWVGQVRMLVELSELAEATVWADKGLDVHRDHVELLAAKAQAVARQGDGARAIALNDAAMKGRGASHHVWLSRGEAILAGSRGGEEHCFEKARIEARGDPAVLAAVARIYMGYGHAPLALKWAEDAVRKDARYAFAWRIQGEAELAVGLGDRAARSLRTALSLDPDCPGASDLLTRLAEEPFLERLWRRVCGLWPRRRSRR